MAYFDKESSILFSVKRTVHATQWELRGRRRQHVPIRLQSRVPAMVSHDKINPKVAPYVTSVSEFIKLVIKNFFQNTSVTRVSNARKLRSGIIFPLYFFNMNIKDKNLIVVYEGQGHLNVPESKVICQSQKQIFHGDSYSLHCRLFCSTFWHCIWGPVVSICRALQPPGWRRDWHCGVRVAKSEKLVGFISAVPALIKMYDK